MPMLPLPGPSGIEAILMHRAKQELLNSSDNKFAFSPSVTKKSSHDDIYDFEYVPYGLLKGSRDADEPLKNSPQNMSNFYIISKGQGFMAINVTVDGMDFTGMLYSHNKDGMPGLLASDDRERFVDLCRHDTVSESSAGFDQWTSALADRQLLPARQRRFSAMNFAKRGGRMICYSCLCVVPEDRSMPFACNCKDRQRQRASRLRCGGYQSARERLVVVAHAGTRNNAGTSLAGTSCLPKRKMSGTKDEKAELTSKVPRCDFPTNSDFSQTQPLLTNTNGTRSKRVLEDSSQYVVRNNGNSPLQITLLKISNCPEATSDGVNNDNGNDATAADHNYSCGGATSGNHRHRRRHQSGEGGTDNKDRGKRHHRHNRHRRIHQTQSNHDGDDNDNDDDDDDVIRRNSDAGCDPRQLHNNNRNLPLKQRKQEAIDYGDTTAKFEHGDPLNSSLNCAPAVSHCDAFLFTNRDSSSASNLQLVNSSDSFTKVESEIESASVLPLHNLVNSSPSHFVKSPILSVGTNRLINDKRLSLEAQIISIKERLLNSAPCSPHKTSSNTTVGAKKSTSDSLITSKMKSSNSNATIAYKRQMAQRMAPALLAEMTPKLPMSQHCNSSPCSSEHSFMHSSTSTFRTSLAANLPLSVTSTVSALIRAEIYRHETTSSPSNAAIFPHGITRGTLVWARALPSAYWPGLVIGVSAENVRVAWCGEHTYNEVSISMVSDFLGALSTRFVPNAKENRTNRKFCNAVAEALALAQPPLTELNRRLNSHVAKLLSEKYGWDLSDIAVYRAGKLVQMRAGSLTSTASSRTTMPSGTPTKF